jgi:hypothetical protein
MVLLKKYLKLIIYIKMSVASVSQLLQEQGGGGGSSVIRSAIYKAPSSPYLIINSNTVYSHQFDFTDFNVSANTVVNLTFDTASNFPDGTVVDPNTTPLPIYQVIGLSFSNSGTTGSITVKFIGIILSGGTASFGLVSLNIIAMNN